jgi:hydroxymethylpyrimidine/phosphomethylpyrimidine kinase
VALCANRPGSLARRVRPHDYNRLKKTNAGLEDGAADRAPPPDAAAHHSIAVRAPDPQRQRLMSRPASQPPAPPVVLVFAGSDPTCGAGLQADLLTLAALGCHPLTVVTALTVQDSTRVAAFDAVPPQRVADQARRLLDDLPVRALKVGMTASAANVEVIGTIAAEHPELPLVLDPVLAAGAGDALAADDIVPAMRALLLPRTLVATPNSIEARRLALVAGDAPLDACAQALLACGCAHVLVTGTHEESADVVNTLYGRPHTTGNAPAVRVRRDTWPRLPGSYHGSGCTLAAALAAHLARGRDVADAAFAAQRYTWSALAAGFRLGRGQAFPDRLAPVRDGCAP